MSRTSSIRQRGVAFAGIVIVAAGLVVGGGVASAHPPPEVLYAGVILPVTTSTHEHLELTIGASRYDVGGTEDTVYTVTLATPADTESHTFTFPMPNKDFTIGSNGDGKLDVPPVDLGNYGRAKLKIEEVGKPVTKTCSSTASVVDEKVKISGGFYFDPHATGADWGDVGNKHKVTNIRPHGTVVSAFGQTSRTCESSTPPQCEAGVTWNAANSKDTILLNGGERNRKHGFVDAERTVRLTDGPTGTTRSDELDLLGPPQLFKPGPGGSATLRIGVDKDPAGSAKVVSSGSGIPVTCGTKASEIWDGTFDPVDNVFKARGEVFSPITLGGGIGSITSVTK